MKLTSAEVRNGAAIKNEQVFKGFGCTGNWGAKGDQKFRYHFLRSRCADRQRLVALGSLQYSGIDHIGAKERWRREREAYA